MQHLTHSGHLYHTPQAQEIPQKTEQNERKSWGMGGGLGLLNNTHNSALMNCCTHELEQAWYPPQELYKSDCLGILL